MSTDEGDYTKYSVNDEPQEDWTMEELFHWQILKARQAVDDQYKANQQYLEQRFRQAVERMWKEYSGDDTLFPEQLLKHREQKQQQQQAGADAENENTENMLPLKTRVANLSTTVKARDVPKKSKAVSQNDKASSSSADAINTVTAEDEERMQVRATKIKVDIITGLYAGKSFLLQPKPSNPCLVGRSKGKKLMSSGISLPRDVEVSTKHGKFHVEVDGVSGAATFFYTDTGSTNGTKLHDGTDMQPDKPIQLENGTVLVIGQSTMNITLL